MPGHRRGPGDDVVRGTGALRGGRAARCSTRGVPPVGGRPSRQPERWTAVKGEPLGASALGQVGGARPPAARRGRRPSGPRRVGGDRPTRRAWRQRRCDRPAPFLSRPARDRLGCPISSGRLVPRGRRTEGEPMNRFTGAGHVRAKCAPRDGDRPMFRRGRTTVTWAEHHPVRGGRGVARRRRDPGDRVAFLDRNGLRLLRGALRRRLAGAVNVAVNWRLARGDGSRHRRLGRHRPRHPSASSARPGRHGERPARR